MWVFVTPSGEHAALHDGYKGSGKIGLSQEYTAGASSVHTTAACTGGACNAVATTRLDSFQTRLLLPNRTSNQA